MLKIRGLGHVEAILSFVIFIGFIVFAFVFFSPFQSGRTLKSTSDYAWREVNEFSSSRMEAYSVYISNTNTPLIVAVNISDSPSGWNATVENSSGGFIQAHTTSGGIVNFQRPVNNFIRLKFMEDFSQGPPITGVLIAQNNFTISSFEVSEIISEKRILDLNATYFANYSGLKKQFNLPSRTNFGFVVIFSDGSTIEASKLIPENAEVISKSDRLQIVRLSTGIIEYAEVRVFVW